MKDSTVIERRFLLKEAAPGLTCSRPEILHIGCLSAQGNREVFLCRSGSKRFLMTREGRQRLLRESSVPLAIPHFESLWELTEGARLIKKIQAARWNDLEFTLETIECGRGSLAIAIIRFARRALATSFQQPFFFGSEITHRADFSDAHLALHGIPPALNGQSQSGAMPFLFKNGVLHIVLVTSSSGSRWIVPKGGLEKEMTRQEVALMEAAEEAGAIGALEHGLKTECRMADQRKLHLYPLRVAVLLPHWPERLMRRRVVLPIYRALLRIRDPELAQAIRRLARQIEP